MAVNSATLVFLDASCFVAAAGSPSGGSAFVLQVCQRRFLRLASSQAVLVEAERNIITKRPAEHLSTYHLQLRSTPLTLAPQAPQELVHRYLETFREDAHVVAAALLSQSSFLITLDKRLQRRVNASGLSFRVLSPGELITDELPTHPNFAQIRV